MDQKKIEDINTRHKMVYEEYKKSNKENFIYYWEQLCKLEEEYFREKFGFMEVEK